MKEHTFELKHFLPVMKTHELIKGWEPYMFRICSYTLVNPRWTKTTNVFEFDIFHEDELFATYRANFNDFREALIDQKQADFEIKGCTEK
jgi:hypothetical protein